VLAPHDVLAAVICQKVSPKGKVTVKLAAGPTCPKNFQVLVDLGDVATLKSDVGALKTDVGALKTDGGGLKTDVGALKTQVPTLQTQISNVSKDLDALADDLQSQVDDLVDHASQEVSEIYVEGANAGTAGFGSAVDSGNVRRFKSLITEEGTAIEYVQSSEDGDSFIIHRSGWYAVSANDYNNGNALDSGISLNTDDLDTHGSELAPDTRLCAFGSSGTTGTNNGCGVTTHLFEGDELRLHSVHPGAGVDPFSTWMRVTLVHQDFE
jgi:outer membrane murein-binding lipoprotein Lpp